MNWEIIINQSSSLQEYRLMEKNNHKMILKYNPRHQSARVISGNHHRLFFLESAGSLTDKTVLKNEYGIEIGALAFDRPHNSEGWVMIDGKKYSYHIDSNQLILYKNNPHQPLAECNIIFTNNIGHSVSTINLTTVDSRCIILGLCWYTSLQVTNGNMPEILTVA